MTYTIKQLNLSQIKQIKDKELDELVRQLNTQLLSIEKNRTETDRIHSKSFQLMMGGV